VHALHLHHAQGQACASQVVASQTSICPYNLSHLINIQNTHVYVQKSNADFCIKVQFAQDVHIMEKIRISIVQINQTINHHVVHTIHFLMLIE
jgi:hypothetical protein